MNKFNDKITFLKFVRVCAERYRNYQASEYLYNLLLKKRLNNSLKELIEDDEFLQLCYVTLDSWNMNSRGSRLKDFDEFKNEIRKNQQTLADLDEYEIQKLDDDRLVAVLDKIESLFKSTSITISTKTKRNIKDRLVSNSKILHFLLPKLCIPMDRKYTLSFFHYTTYDWSTYKKIFRWSVNKMRELKLVIIKQKPPRKWVVSCA